ncbi:MAG: hypothetical protein HYY44_01565 [Deltaproteobacteria bacterium]|nr:hypothetical protein [Deltaproteobacteria bacterium]
MKKTVLLKNLLLLSLLSILPAIFLGAGDSQAGTPTDGTATGVDLEPIAKDHLAQKLGVDSPTLVLKRNNCLKADPCTISFTQVYQNIPVFGSSATVWFKKGQIIETRSPLLAKNLPSSLEPQLKEEEAHKLVFGWLKGEKYELIGEPISSTGLTLYVFQIWAQPKAKTAPDDSTGSAQLAYRVDLKRLRRPPHLAEDDMFFSQPTFIIDANEGQILEIIENLSYGTVAGNITGPVYPTNPYEGSSLVPYDPIRCRWPLFD